MARDLPERVTTLPTQDLFAQQALGPIPALISAPAAPRAHIYVVEHFPAKGNGLFTNQPLAGVIKDRMAQGAFVPIILKRRSTAALRESFENDEGEPLPSSIDPLTDEELIQLQSVIALLTPSERNELKAVQPNDSPIQFIFIPGLNEALGQSASYYEVSRPVYYFDRHLLSNEYFWECLTQLHLALSERLAVVVKGQNAEKVQARLRAQVTKYRQSARARLSNAMIVLLSGGHRSSAPFAMSPRSIYHFLSSISWLQTYAITLLNNLNHVIHAHASHDYVELISGELQVSRYLRLGRVNAIGFDGLTVLYEKAIKLLFQFDAIAREELSQLSRKQGPLKEFSPEARAAAKVVRHEKRAARHYGYLLRSMFQQRLSVLTEKPLSGTTSLKTICHIAEESANRNVGQDQEAPGKPVHFNFDLGSDIDLPIDFWDSFAIFGNYTGNASVYGSGDVVQIGVRVEKTKERTIVHMENEGRIDPDKLLIIWEWAIGQSRPGHYGLGLKEARSAALRNGMFFSVHNMEDPARVRFTLAFPNSTPLKPTRQIKAERRVSERTAHIIAYLVEGDFAAVKARRRVQTPPIWLISESASHGDSIEVESAKWLVRHTFTVLSLPFRPVREGVAPQTQMGSAYQDEMVETLSSFLNEIAELGRSSEAAREVNLLWATQQASFNEILTAHCPDLFVRHLISDTLAHARHTALDLLTPARIAPDGIDSKVTLDALSRRRRFHNHIQTVTDILRGQTDRTFFLPQIAELKGLYIEIEAQWQRLTLLESKIDLSDADMGESALLAKKAIGLSALARLAYISTMLQEEDKVRSFVRSAETLRDSKDYQAVTRIVDEAQNDLLRRRKSLVAEAKMVWQALNLMGQKETFAPDIREDLAALRGTFEYEMAFEDISPYITAEHGWDKIIGAHVTLYTLYSVQIIDLKLSRYAAAALPELRRERARIADIKDYREKMKAADALISLLPDSNVNTELARAKDPEPPLYSIEELKSAIERENLVLMMANRGKDSNKLGIFVEMLTNTFSYATLPPESVPSWGFYMADIIRQVEEAINFLFEGSSPSSIDRDRYNEIWNYFQAKLIMVSRTLWNEFPTTVFHSSADKEEAARGRLNPNLDYHPYFVPTFILWNHLKRRLDEAS